MLKSFIAFNINAISNLIYMFTSNLSFIVITISLLIVIAFRIYDVVDESIREEQNIL